jgi:hypothetical protein
LHIFAQFIDGVNFNESFNAFAECDLFVIGGNMIDSNINTVRLNLEIVVLPLELG